MTAGSLKKRLLGLPLPERLEQFKIAQKTIIHHLISKNSTKTPQRG